MHMEAILAAKGDAVFTVAPGASLSEAVDQLASRNIGALVVCDPDGRPVGILSERDVVRFLRARGPAALETPVSACMTAGPITCGPEAGLDDVMGLMTRRRIRHLPVMRDGRLAGLVSIGDVVKRKIEKAEAEAAALKEYINS